MITGSQLISQLCYPVQAIGVIINLRAYTLRSRCRPRRKAAVSRHTSTCACVAGLLKEIRTKEGSRLMKHPASQSSFWVNFLNIPIMIDLYYDVNDNRQKRALLEDDIKQDV
uniref:Uncharacterized protein n=1 Tax=Helicotheca tamesis TaxID=374047 RepID=A0A7S2HFG3_9STRA